MNELHFKALAAQGFNRIPLMAEALADLDTPLSLYLKLAYSENEGKNSFLFESVEGGERFGRYSFIGLPAHTLIRTSGKHCQIVKNGTVIEEKKANPIEFVQEFQERFKIAPLPGMPRFVGGLAGYFGYDIVRFIEPKLQNKEKNDDGLSMPDLQLLLCEELAVVDNLKGKLYLIVHVDPNEPDALGKGKRRLTALKNNLSNNITRPDCSPSKITNAVRSFLKEDFLSSVIEAKELIASGELMQVQVGQRITKPFTSSPLSLYRALRSINPSPYMYLYNFDDHHIIGTSPEILVRRETGEKDDTVVVRPLAGTRPRGTTPTEDKRLAEELLADEKEIAEHVMLIDLARNDLGRIGNIGSVKVVDKLIIEKYSHVQHIVSSVEATVSKNITNFDVLRATFPAGTLTGAPKIRAISAIDELEPIKRGLYGGAVGYLSFSGEMDLAIAIRTGIIKDQNLYVQASAGIVADSVPELEWQETENKASALLQAADCVQNGFDIA